MPGKGDPTPPASKPGDIPEPVVTQTEKKDPEQLLTDTAAKEEIAASNKTPSTPDPTSATPTTQPDKTKKVTIRNKPFADIKLGFSTGIGFDAHLKGTGYSLVEEFSFSKYFAVSSGIKLMLRNSEKYNEPKDYNRDMPEEFSKHYDPQHKIDTNICNIDIRNKSYAVPVFLSFRLPLKNDFKVLFSAGTDLTISSTDHVNYEHKNPYGSPPGSKPEPPHDIEHKNTTNAFHEMSLSIGLQKTWKHFGVDLSPNATLPFQKRPVWDGEVEVVV
jgi:hypothetical protein